MASFRFKARPGTYSIPATLQTYNDNFKDVLARSERLPGVDGGIDLYGSGRGVGPVGNITITFYLVSRDPNGMQALIDTLATTKDWGKGVLYYQPSDSGLAERWCHCRVNNITTSRGYRAGEVFQTVQMIFQADDPFWYGKGNASGSIIGIDFTFGSSRIGGGSTVTAASGLSTSITSLAPSGNAFTFAQIGILPKASGPAQTCTDPIIRRVVNGAVMDELRYHGNLAAGDKLFIDPRRHKALKNGVSVADDIEFLTADWMRLMPGSNTLKVLFANSSDAADVNIRYLDRWV
jgi:hypothetical protein